MFLIVKEILDYVVLGDKMPFTKAYDEAEITGYCLADFLIDHFSDRFINLVGFSLGTRVIYCCLKRLQ